MMVYLSRYRKTFMAKQYASYPPDQSRSSENERKKTKGSQLFSHGYLHLPTLIILTKSDFEISFELIYVSSVMEGKLFKLINPYNHLENILSIRIPWDIYSLGKDQIHHEIDTHMTWEFYWI